ncbi:hypothetical protein WN944_009345 [Citrus x changshan-huyou]|uniref:Uncharacterized protein n=1 Tax=Citrus x changshan-huyou TaxID=2935761 RepID=A0AAP0MPQ5_9ROSI
MTSSHVGINIELKNNICFRPSNPATAALVATYGADDIAWSNYGLEWKKLSKLFVGTMISNTSLDASYGRRKQETLRVVVWRWHACIAERTNLGAGLKFRLVELMSHTRLHALPGITANHHAPLSPPTHPHALQRLQKTQNDVSFSSLEVQQRGNDLLFLP